MISNIKKGETICSLSPWKIFPLFPEPEVDNLFLELPNFSSYDHNPLGDLTAEVNKLSMVVPSTKNVLRRIAKNDDDLWSIYTVISTMSLVLSGVVAIRSNFGPNAPPSRERCSTTAGEDTDLSVEAWTWIQDRMSWVEWVDLHRYVQEHLWIVSAPHPLQTYAIQTVPFFTREQVAKASNLLGLESKLLPTDGRQEYPTTGTLAMRLSQLLRDTYQPRSFGILLREANQDWPCPVRHSCLPSAALQLESISRVNLVALYDLDNGDSSKDKEISISVDGGVTGAEGEARRRCAQMRHRHNSSCLLCAPVAVNGETPQHTWQSTVRLGHYYFQQEQHHEAESCYNQSLQLNNCLCDIRHALGALHLAQGKFLDAQLTWKEAASKIRALGRSVQCHKGIGLQLKKQHAYNYLKTDPVNKSPQTMSYKSQTYFDKQCFVTPMLWESECKRLIDIANEAGMWTTGRHHAVPTNDVPIHQVPELLDWFCAWMEQECEPLLMQQFQIDNPQEKRFYVHDAFVVRYGGSKERSNHLTCHLDECTHSLVICLNKDFEGGGTYFHDFNTVLSPKVGEVVSFKGDTLRHGGDVVTQGTRFILAVFLYLDWSYAAASGKSDSTEGGAFKEIAKHGSDQCRKRQTQPLFQEAKKQKAGFLFSFNIQGVGD